MSAIIAPSSRTVDLAVVGLGSIGSMALWQATEAAKRENPQATVLGIEQFSRVHTRGSYAGESRLFRVALKEGSKYVKLALAARDLWVQLSERTGRDVFVPCKALSVAAGNFQGIIDTKEVLEEFHLPHTLLETEELRNSYPQFAIDDGDIGILDHLGGGIRPELAVALAQEEALKIGAEIIDKTPVTAIDNSHFADSGTVTIVTEKGTVHAKRVIVTTGSWASELIPEIRDLITVHKLPLTWSAPLNIAEFLPDRLPIFLRDKVLSDGTRLHVYGAPSLDGYSVKVSVEPLDTFVEDIRELEGDVEEEFKYLVGRQVAEIFPDMMPYVVRASMHHDGFAEGNVPVIDSTLPGITVAVGMSGRGMKFAPIYGKLVSDLSLTGNSELYDPSFSIAAHV